MKSMKLEWVCHLQRRINSTVWNVWKTNISNLDELEGTLRGHIGLIEEALDRLEGKATEADRGKKM